ncbi:conserved hypothetical protein [Rubrobacter xylanophilus DSM 9941]|uniref:Uncharacterized protein n=1 Tax=Rubrobacter xylanophilus (strain DSM 9941 / JCM 11954 / NBRC 16129 / PRD-1) TaxID=266117 RepID=Q1ASH0_RUBXD|nr:hypothetical protein [Rubrobacter xylanophilus]ABG05658.1 conserved hypothetical protein [Rubrobacter xylanophilus DSM 9941]
MCVLCGQDFVARPHWTDRHVVDRALAAGPGADPTAYQRERRRDRAHRVALAGAVLRHYGLRVDDWEGSRYVLRDRKGRSELVQDLGSLWPAAERLSGRTPDPLDPALLARLDGGG